MIKQKLLLPHQLLIGDSELVGFYQQTYVIPDKQWKAKLMVLIFSRADYSLSLANNSIRNIVVQRLIMN